MKTKEMSDTQLAYHVSRISIGANTLLSIGKILTGVIANSSAMITDGIDSASDVISSFVVLAGIKISKKAADEDHEYGHEKLECIVSLVLGMILFLTSLLIGWSGLKKIVSGTTEDLAIPGMLALVVAFISIISKESLYRYVYRAATKINSTSLKGEALNFRSDAFSSIGAFVGILGSRMGFPVLDPIASLLICVFIGKGAIDLFKEATDQLVDKSCDAETEEAMLDKLSELPGVYRVDNLKTRLSGNRVYVDTEIAADHRISFERSHEIAESANRMIVSDFPEVKSCMVHINPVTVGE